MYKNFSDNVKTVLVNAQAYSKNSSIEEVGTEFVLLAMFELEDSVTYALLDEYDVTKNEIIETIESLDIIRKSMGDLYTKVLVEILENAIALKNNLGSKFVEEEHLFLAILAHKENIACSIIDILGIDLDDLIYELKDGYDLEIEKEEVSPFNTNHVTNLTKLSEDDSLPPYVNRDNYIERLELILNRKGKNNPLLVGSAGVGKTAIVEGLAKVFKDKKLDYEIVSLELGSIVAGSKYRGDFEEKLLKVINTVKKNKKYILFIDELHNIVGAGSSEGSMDAANILKPILARGQIKCIGATTIEEYKKHIEKDKALSRRFQPLFINEPSLDTVIEILKGIKGSYEKFHNVKINDSSILYLVNECHEKILNRKFPDKAIDLLDEVLTRARMAGIKEISNDDINKSVEFMTGIKKELLISNDLYFKGLNKHITKRNLNIRTSKTLLSINYVGNDSGLDILKEDLKKGYNVTNEMFLNIDLSSYQEDHSIASLIGSPPGYVGFETGGVLSEHISNFPSSVIVVKNFFNGSLKVRDLIKEMVKDGEFVDLKGRNINCSNTIFILRDFNKDSVNKLGYFTDDEVSNKDSTNYDIVFDEVIKYSKVVVDESLKSKYVNQLRLYGYSISINFDLKREMLNKFDQVIYDLVSSYPKGEYDIDHFDNDIIINSLEQKAA